jgi:hypothetical protein
MDQHDKAEDVCFEETARSIVSRISDEDLAEIMIPIEKGLFGESTILHLSSGGDELLISVQEFLALDKQRQRKISISNESGDYAKISTCSPCRTIFCLIAATILIIGLIISTVVVLIIKDKNTILYYNFSLKIHKSKIGSIFKNFNFDAPRVVHRFYKSHDYKIRNGNSK